MDIEMPELNGNEGRELRLMENEGTLPPLVIVGC